MKNVLEKFTGACAGRRGRWVTLAVWILAVAVLSAVFPNVNKVTDNSAANLPASAMSARAEKVAEKQFPDAGTPLLIAWYREGGLSQQDYGTIAKLYADLKKNPLPAQSFIPPYEKMPPQVLGSQASKDGTTMVTPVFMEKSAGTDELADNLKELKKRVTSLESKAVLNKKLADTGLHVRFTGPAGISTDAVSLFSKADITLLVSTVLLVLVLLIVLYRSPILALLPLIGVIFAYGAIGPILGILAKEGIITVDSQATSIMTVLLFGAGTDYCLFLVSKYRECLLEEEDKIKALHTAIRHSGGAIMVSAITVVLSLFTLLFAHYGTYQRFAVPFSLAIFIMGIAALTLLPALLSILGRASFFPFIPRTEQMASALEAKKGKKIRRHAAHGKWSRKVGEAVTRKPWLIIVLSVIILGGLASFVPKIAYTQNLIESFPKDMPSREGYEIIADHFSPGELAPVQVIANTEGKGANVKAALEKLPFVDTVTGPQYGEKNKQYVSYKVQLKDNPYSEKAIQSNPVIQKQLQKAGLSKSQIWIGGVTSSLYDTAKVTERDMKVIVPSVIFIIAILLLLYLRSLVAMVYLILTVLLSYVAALGAGWLLIHYGLGISAIQDLIPLYAFVFLVALGEDYNIFMISGIWKNKQHLPHRRAIALGVTETGAVITSAGLILAGTFAVLTVLPIQILVQFGIVTAIGVLLDTFVVRPLLVPAITTVLGRYAFWPGKLFAKAEPVKSED
ncbi:MMPL family transporter [Weizmannia sp. FSL W8-1119]|uniref:MMPL family transporter n=1 Tax=Weizmannia sp. FSL W8-1119 TaxID=2954709 RepID=UPI0030F7B820